MDGFKITVMKDEMKVTTMSYYYYFKYNTSVEYNAHYIILQRER